MKIGTNAFVSGKHAARYYRETGAAANLAQALNLVADKIASREITIGQPDLKDGESLFLIDNGTRYAIEDNAP